MGIFNASCRSKARLDGKIAVITGCNTGIGKETTKDFFIRGAHVIMACRNVKKADEAMRDIQKQCDGKYENLGKLEVVELNLCNMKSIRDCADKLLERNIKINLLINNAGIMTCPFDRTDDGFEIQFGTNHLGHFLLTLLLLPRIIQSTPARIVNVSSLAHTMGHVDVEDLNWEKRKYNTTVAYSQSKICNVLFTKELAKRLAAANIQGVTVYSLHPGVIATDLGRHLDASFCPGLSCLMKYPGRIVIKSPKQGAQTTIHCAVDENAAKETGLYYSECKVKEPHANGKNMEHARIVWEESLKYVQLDNYDPFRF